MCDRSWSGFAYHLEFNKLNGTVPTLTMKEAINIITLLVLSVTGPQIRFLHERHLMAPLIVFVQLRLFICLIASDRKWHRRVSCFDDLVCVSVVTSISRMMTRWQITGCSRYERCLNFKSVCVKKHIESRCWYSSATLNSKSLAAAGGCWDTWVEVPLKNQDEWCKTSLNKSLYFISVF